LFCLNSIVTWTAAESLGKVAFLEKAEQLLTGNPDDLAFDWDSRSQLCAEYPIESDLIHGGVLCH
jgi:hypothetical protein